MGFPNLAFTKEVHGCRAWATLCEGKKKTGSCRADEIEVIRTSSFELFCATSHQLLDLLGFDRLSGPRVLPSWLGGKLVCQVVEVGVLFGFELRAIPALEAGEETRHVVSQAMERDLK